VIVGGGLAGLSACWRLRHRDVVLLESGDRVGGRIRSEPRGGYFLNWGGHVFAGAVSSGTTALLDETGVQSRAIPGALTGLAMNGRLLLDGRPATLPFRIPMPWPARLALLRAGSKVGVAVLRYARIVGLRPGEDEATRQQRVYDFMNDRSFADFVGDLPEEARALFQPTVSRSAADLDEISAGAGVGYFSLVFNIGSGLGNNIAGGPSTLTESIAAELGDDVQRGATVVEVVTRRSSVVVRYAQAGEEKEVEARCVVLATPAPVSHRVGVDLPTETREALAKVVYGPYVSAAYLTDEATRQPWDDAYAIATPKRSFAVALNMTNTVRGTEAHRGRGSSLMVFSPAALARHLLERSDEEVIRTYTADLDAVLPGVADTVVEAQVQRWPLGAPYCFPGRAALQPTLTKPTGRVFLAGDYLGTLYTETAIQTGFTAARNAVSLLEQVPTSRLSDRPRLSAS
jgi:oxygen-dependent protoporphyrinogen oxidase